MALMCEETNIRNLLVEGYQSHPYPTPKRGRLSSRYVWPHPNPTPKRGRLSPRGEGPVDCGSPPENNYPHIMNI